MDVNEYRAYWRDEYTKQALVQVQHEEFSVTSTHRNWRGKIKCNHCKATGYPGSIEKNPLWWGQTHGRNCVKRWAIN